MIAVKICGVTRKEDADVAAAAGADYVGFVLWAKSPRAATLGTVRDVVAGLPSRVTPVGVFVDPAADEVAAARDAGIRVAQIHGEASVDVRALGVPILRAVHLDGDGIRPAVTDDLVLLDAHDPLTQGGTGRTIDWERAARIARTRRVVLAGGLTPANVSEAIETVHPFGVDVASGVESAPGIKDAGLVRAFIAAARAARPVGSRGGVR